MLLLRIVLKLGWLKTAKTDDGRTDFSVWGFLNEICFRHVNGRVLVSVADGTVAVFRRRLPGGFWDTSNYHLLNIGQPDHAIRSLLVVPVSFSSDEDLAEPNRHCVWAGCRNKIVVFDPLSLKIRVSLQQNIRRHL